MKGTNEKENGGQNESCRKEWTVQEGKIAECKCWRKEKKNTGLMYSSRGYVQRSVDLVIAMAFAKRKEERGNKTNERGVDPKGVQMDER
jgi:hypothetical protein